MFLVELEARTVYSLSVGNQAELKQLMETLNIDSKVELLLLAYEVLGDDVSITMQIIVMDFINKNKWPTPVALAA